jgi:hypothetical protein
MKAKSIILFLLVASLMACSNNPEALVRKFEKAVAAGNYAKADEIANKMAELGGDSFTQEQKERISNALMQVAENDGIAYEDNYSYDYYEEPDYSADKWKDFAGTTYRASELLGDMWYNYAFSYNSNGKGKYIIFTTIPGTNVVEDQLNFTVYKVTSDDNYIYLHCDDLDSTAKIKIKGSSLYTANGAERYEVWQ